jgi:RES domain
MPKEQAGHSILFRVVYELAAADPLPARQDQGRFHTGKDLKSKTYYLSEEEQTCWTEIEHHRGGPVNPDLYRVFQIHVSPSKVVDLTKAGVRQRYGITRKELEDEFNRVPCQELGKRLRTEGIQAVRTFSAARAGAINVALFAENLDPSCGLTYKKTTSIVFSRRTP